MNETLHLASRWARWVTAGMLAVAFVVAVAAGTLSRSMMSSASDYVAATTADLPSQGTVDMVVEIKTMAPGERIDGLLLVNAEGRYHRTDEHVFFTVPSDTPIVMGNAGDIIAGAVLHIRGQKQGEDFVVNRVVVLTSSVEPE